MENHKDKNPAGDGCCPLCQERRVEWLDQGGWMCPSCLLGGTDADQRHRGIAPALLSHFSAAEVAALNPKGWPTRLGLRHLEDTALAGYYVSPQTALRIAEVTGREIVRIRKTPLLPLHMTAGYRLESRPCQGKAGQAPLPLTIGAICRPGDTAAITELVIHSLPFCDHFAFVLDSADPEDTRRFSAVLTADPTVARSAPDIRVTYHALNRDFGAQRNHLQSLAGTDWVLHLDTDERPSTLMEDGIARALRHADLTGVTSVGFARANYVDGRLSALWPDIQFRLNRRFVRYKGAVHESPDVPWQQQDWSLHGHILHFLTADRLPKRAESYEAISTGGGRPHDRALLETPYEVPYEDDPLAAFRPAPTQS